MALRARRIGLEGDLQFRLDFFSVEDIAARVLLDKHPLANGRIRVTQVAIIGFGRLGRAVLREIARRSLTGGSPLNVRVRGERPETVSNFLNLFPVIRRNCLVTSGGDAPDRPDGDAPTLIFVCLPDNDDALRAGLAAAHSLTARSDSVVICMSQLSPFGEVLTGEDALLENVGGRLSVFEVIAEGCVPGRITEDLADQLARAIHQAYLDKRAGRGDSPQVNQSMRPWEELPDDIKHANLAQAAHIGIKLNAIDCAVVPESVIAPDFAFTDAEIELLAEMEHRRWVQERLGEGYVQGPNREGKQHPDLVDWQYLSEHAREKDRDAVCDLPAILRQAGFQILRLPPRSA
jgi:hypothetical protein